MADVAAAVHDQVALDHRANCIVAAPAPWFALDDGDAALVVTAAHATQPFREGAYRFADGGGTGALARALNRLTGAVALYTVAASPSDPNFYDDNAFKETLGRLLERKHPRLLLDIHGSHPYRPYDVDLGTMAGASLLGQTELVGELAAALRGEGIANLSLDYFEAERQQTLTKFAAAHGVAAIQLEINSTWLDPAGGDLAAHRFSQLLQALVRFTEARRLGTLRRAPAAAGGGLPEPSCESRVPAR